MDTINQAGYFPAIGKFTATTWLGMGVFSFTIKSRVIHSKKIET
jgi:hypothetical protein